MLNIMLKTAEYINITVEYPSYNNLIQKVVPETFNMPLSYL